MLPGFFATNPPPPERLSVGCAIARMIDGLGYRLYWALEGLTEEDCAYRLTEGASSIYEIIWHELGLVNWVYMHVYGEQMRRPEPILEQGAETLRALARLRETFLAISDDDLAALKLDDAPFWDYVNRPLSDALHHAGQISILRRGAGNPVRPGKSRPRSRDQG